MAELKKYMLNLKGKQYLPVAPRVMMFRQEHPAGKIVTEVVQIDVEKGFCLCMAEVYDAAGNMLARSFGSETAKDFFDYIEKAGTKAVGRTLALAGYGTLEAIELEEGAIVDSPVAGEVRPVAPKTLLSFITARCGISESDAVLVRDLLIDKYGNENSALNDGVLPYGQNAVKLLTTLAIGFIGKDAAEKRWAALTKTEGLAPHAAALALVKDAHGIMEGKTEKS